MNHPTRKLLFALGAFLALAGAGWLHTSRPTPAADVTASADDVPAPELTTTTTTTSPVTTTVVVPTTLAVSPSTEITTEPPMSVAPVLPTVVAVSTTVPPRVVPSSEPPVSTTATTDPGPTSTAGPAPTTTTTAPIPMCETSGVRVSGHWASPMTQGGHVVVSTDSTPMVAPCRVIQDRIEFRVTDSRDHVVFDQIQTWNYGPRIVSKGDWVWPDFGVEWDTSCTTSDMQSEFSARSIPVCEMPPPGTYSAVITVDGGTWGPFTTEITAAP